MIRNYFLITCENADCSEYDQQCHVIMDSPSEDYCRNCECYVHSSNSDFEDEDEYNAILDEQEEYTSGAWDDDNSDSYDIGDYYYEHS